MPTILLIRHGQGSFGSADYDVLSEVGRQQALDAHAHHATRVGDGAVLVAGSLNRQRDTAAPWDGELGLDARWDEYDSAAVLRDHGEAEVSLESTELTSRGFQDLLDPALERWMQGDGWADFRDATTGALTDLAASLGSGRTGVAFTSAGVIAACVAHLLGDTERIFIPLNRIAVNTGVTKILVGSRGMTLVSFNAHDHLPPERVTFR